MPAPLHQGVAEPPRERTSEHPLYHLASGDGGVWHVSTRRLVSITLTLPPADGASSGLHHLPASSALFVKVLWGLFASSSAKAAASTVFAATVENPKDYRGKYVVRGWGGGVHVKPWVGPMLDDKLPKDLWEVTEKIVQDKRASTSV